MRLYHGTNTAYLPAIRERGLNSPCLSNVLEVAQQYADAADGEGEPVVIVVDVDPAALRIDRPSLEEPVGYGDFTGEDVDQRVSDALDKLGAERPECVLEPGIVEPPDDAYWVTLEACGTVKAEGMIPWNGEIAGGALESLLNGVPARQVIEGVEPFIAALDAIAADKRTERWKNAGELETTYHWTMQDGTEVSGAASPSSFNLDRLQIPPDKRRQGLAKKWLAKLGEIADRTGTSLTGFGVPDEGSHSKFKHKWVNTLRDAGFETDVENVSFLTGMTPEEVRAHRSYPTRDELIRHPRTMAEAIESSIEEFIESYGGSGFGGDCGNFAIRLNRHLGGIGEYVGAINTQIWSLGEHWIGHVALKVGSTLYDASGSVDSESFRAWGMVDEDGDESDLYNLTTEECYEAEIVNLSELWGSEVEEKILENTSGGTSLDESDGTHQHDVVVVTTYKETRGNHGWGDHPETPAPDPVSCAEYHNLFNDEFQQFIAPYVTEVRYAKMETGSYHERWFAASAQVRLAIPAALEEEYLELEASCALDTDVSERLFTEDKFWARRAKYWTGKWPGSFAALQEELETVSCAYDQQVRRFQNSKEFWDHHIHMAAAAHHLKRPLEGD